MKFEDFIRKGDVRKVTKDAELAKALFRTAEKDFTFFRNLKVDENSSRKLVSNYYDILRSILEGMAILEGFKVYAHDAFTYYLIYKGESRLAEEFDRFRRIRNAINYYGRDISVNEAKDVLQGITELIDKIKSKYAEGAEK